MSKKALQRGRSTKSKGRKKYVVNEPIKIRQPNKLKQMESTDNNTFTLPNETNNLIIKQQSNKDEKSSLLTKKKETKKSRCNCIIL